MLVVRIIEILIFFWLLDKNETLAYALLGTAIILEVTIRMALSISGKGRSSGKRSGHRDRFDKEIEEQEASEREFYNYRVMRDEAREREDTDKFFEDRYNPGDRYDSYDRF